MKAIVLELLKNYALKAMTGLVGWRLQLAKLVLKYAWPYIDKAYDITRKKLFVWAGHAIIEKKKEIDEKNAEKYENALKDGVSENQLDDATSDLLNSHKH